MKQKRSSLKPFEGANRSLRRGSMSTRVADTLKGVATQTKPAYPSGSALAVRRL